MPLITVKAQAPAIPPGTYLGTLISVRPKRLVTQYSKNGEEQDFLEWTWAVEGIEINSLTTLASGPKSRIFEYLTALFGADKVVVDAGFEENDLVGKVALLSIITNDDGFAKIDRVVSAPRTSQPKAAAPKAPTAPVADPGDQPVPVEALGEAEDDLPF
jgi:hypothetical protein